MSTGVVTCLFYTRLRTYLAYYLVHFKIPILRLIKMPTN